MPKTAYQPRKGDVIRFRGSIYEVDETNYNRATRSPYVFLVRYEEQSSRKLERVGRRIRLSAATVSQEARLTDLTVGNNQKEN